MEFVDFEFVERSIVVECLGKEDLRGCHFDRAENFP